MKRFFTFLLLGLFLASGGQPQFNSTASPLGGSLIFTRVPDSEPSILYLEWFGKNLVVIGEGFGDGATVLINGQRMKTRNDGVSPTLVLIAKKARKKIPAEQEITVKAENPNGNRSNEVAFFSGITITSSYANETIHLRVGDIFLLYLYGHGDPPGLLWKPYILGADSTIITQLSDPPPIPKSQGFFRVNKAGQFELNAIGSPQCPPLPPEACSITGASEGRFNVTIIVE